RPAAARGAPGDRAAPGGLPAGAPVPGRARGGAADHTPATLSRAPPGARGRKDQMSHRALIAAGILALGLAVLLPVVEVAGARAAPPASLSGKGGKGQKADRAGRRAEELQQQAQVAQGRGLWAQALRLYQQAYDLRPLPPIQ